MKRLYLYFFVLLVLAASLPASAATIGQWSGSGRTWNNGDFATINALMTANGHTVTADQAITGPNLAAADVFLLGEPGAAPAAGELAMLSGWLSSGGILLMLADSAGSGAAALTATAAALGSGISWGGGASSNPPLAGGVFATTGPPFDIVGELLDISPGTAVSGGIGLAGDYLRYEQIGSGFIFAFADRSDHNTFAPSDGNVNGQLFLNIAAANGPVIPEPATLVLVAAGLFALGLRRCF